MYLYFAGGELGSFSIEKYVIISESIDFSTPRQREKNTLRVLFYMNHIKN